MRLRHLPALLLSLPLLALAQTPPPPATPPAPGEFASCLNQLRAPARAAGVSEDTFNRHTRGWPKDVREHARRLAAIARDAQAEAG